ncbi:MAG: UPF0104 family protein [Cyanothece sp. SIO1E1]|nr:UPF0104 family protein [Cyanothece sp. SIO1E1]
MPTPSRPRLSQAIPILLSLTLLGLSMWTLSQELHQHPPRQVLQSLAAIPHRYLLMAVGLMVLNYLMLTGYDTLAVRYVQRPIAYAQTALVAIISYAVSRNIGFTVLSSSAIRYRFYSAWGFSVGKIAQIIAFCNLSFWIGLLAIGSILFLARPPDVPASLNLPFGSVQPLGVICLAITLGYLGWSGYCHQKPIRIKQWVLPAVPLHISLGQIAVTACDWTLVAGILYVLLPNPNPVTFSSFMGIYLLAQVAGIFSHVPGGLGVFETVIVLMLSPTIATADLLGALLAYRGIYYLLTLGIAVIVWFVYEAGRQKRSKNTNSSLSKAED